MRATTRRVAAPAATSQYNRFATLLAAFASIYLALMFAQVVGVLPASTLESRGIALGQIVDRITAKTPANPRAAAPKLPPKVKQRTETKQAKKGKLLISAAGRSEIPAEYQNLYAINQPKFKVHWSVVAGINNVETHFGRLQLPGVTSGINRYKDKHGNWTGCCRGPGQFNTEEGSGKRIQVNLPNNHSYSYRVGSTWDRMKVDGNKDGIYDIYDPADAVPSTFRYLDYQGANGLNGLRDAVFAYNHSTEYVNNVLGLAAKYRA